MITIASNFNKLIKAAFYHDGTKNVSGQQTKQAGLLD